MSSLMYFLLRLVLRTEHVEIKFIKKRSLMDFSLMLSLMELLPMLIARLKRNKEAIKMFHEMIKTAISQLCNYQ